MIEYLRIADRDAELLGDMQASSRLAETLIYEGRKKILSYIKENYKSMEREKLLEDVMRILANDVFLVFKNYVANKEVDETAADMLDFNSIVVNTLKNRYYDSIYEKIGAGSLKDILKSYVIYVSGSIIQSNLDDFVKSSVRENYIRFCNILLKTLRQYISRAFLEANGYEMEAAGHLIKEFLDTMSDYRKFILNV